jgi:hypothetical protein
MKYVLMEIAVSDRDYQTLERSGEGDMALAVLRDSGLRDKSAARASVVEAYEAPGPYGLESWVQTEPRSDFETQWFDSPAKREIALLNHVNNNRTVRTVHRPSPWVGRTAGDAAALADDELRAIMERWRQDAPAERQGIAEASLFDLVQPVIAADRARRLAQPVAHGPLSGIFGCAAHGGHPHDGRTCLDCQECVGECTGPDCENCR